ncbi:MAG TPA: hypothetical protein VL442_00920, partial [Mucilaginibacter sp.]|nr:hypothetical protein [Mucilaginibacter sp.]
TGDYKLDCRFNKDELINRIKLIAHHKNKIHLYNSDALELIDLIQAQQENTNTIYYFDPPYYLKGPSLYMSHYKHDDHRAVSQRIQQIQNTQWIVSYDNTDEIKQLYDTARKQEYTFYHTAYQIREGKEVLFFSNGLTVPYVSSPTHMKIAKIGT